MTDACVRSIVVCGYAVVMACETLDIRSTDVIADIVPVIVDYGGVRDACTLSCVTVFTWTGED